MGTAVSLKGSTRGPWPLPTDCSASTGDPAGGFRDPCARGYTQTGCGLPWRLLHQTCRRPVRRCLCSPRAWPGQLGLSLREKVPSWECPVSFWPVPPGSSGKCPKLSSGFVTCPSLCPVESQLQDLLELGLPKPRPPSPSDLAGRSHWSQPHLVQAGDLPSCAPRRPPLVS